MDAALFNDCATPSARASRPRAARRLLADLLVIAHGFDMNAAAVRPRVSQGSRSRSSASGSRPQHEGRIEKAATRALDSCAMRGNDLRPLDAAVQPAACWTGRAGCRGRLRTAEATCNALHHCVGRSPRSHKAKRKIEGQHSIPSEQPHQLALDSHPVRREDSHLIRSIGGFQRN
jgi:hypothetical protein